MILNLVKSKDITTARCMSGNTIIKGYHTLLISLLDHLRKDTSINTCPLSAAFYESYRVIFKLR
jgi:hypothetical protein